MSEKNIILTGDRPTGRLHLGHYVGSLKRRVTCLPTKPDEPVKAIFILLLI